MTGQEVVDSITTLIALHGDMKVVRDMQTDRHDGVSDVFTWRGYDGQQYIVLCGVDKMTWLEEVS